jgi:hypothetical protein
MQNTHAMPASVCTLFLTQAVVHIHRDSGSSRIDGMYHCQGRLMHRSISAAKAKWTSLTHTVVDDGWQLFRLRAIPNPMAPLCVVALPRGHYPNHDHQILNLYSYLVVIESCSISSIAFQATKFDTRIP